MCVAPEDQYAILKALPFQAARFHEILLAKYTDGNHKYNDEIDVSTFVEVSGESKQKALDLSRAKKKGGRSAPTQPAAAAAAAASSPPPATFPPATPAENGADVPPVDLVPPVDDSVDPVPPVDPIVAKEDE